MMYCDSMLAIPIVKNSIHHNKTKYISIIYHFMKVVAGNGEFELKFCKTEEMVEFSLNLYQKEDFAT